MNINTQATTLRTDPPKPTGSVVVYSVSIFLVIQDSAVLARIFCTFCKWADSTELRRAGFLAQECLQNLNHIEMNLMTKPMSRNNRQPATQPLLLQAKHCTSSICQNPQVQNLATYREQARQKEGRISSTT